MSREVDTILAAIDRWVDAGLIDEMVASKLRTETAREASSGTRRLSQYVLAVTGGVEDAVKAGAYLAGPPQLLVEKLMALGERYQGLRRVNVGHPIGASQAVILEQLEWFARDVMPAFRQAAAK
jgi:hypothetical protein